MQLPCCMFCCLGCWRAPRDDAIMQYVPMIATSRSVLAIRNVGWLKSFPPLYLTAPRFPCSRCASISEVELISTTFFYFPQSAVSDFLTTRQRPGVRVFQYSSARLLECTSQPASQLFDAVDTDCANFCWPPAKHRHTYTRTHTHTNRGRIKWVHVGVKRTV